MKKHLYQLATQLQEGLRGAAQAGKPIGQVPRALLDAWATLYRWSRSGEPIVRLTDESEEAMLERPLQATLPLARAPLATEALACQLPSRSDWIVIARHAPAPCWVQVWEQIGWEYAQPVLTYSGLLDGVTLSGYLSLEDMPTPADLRLQAGTLLRADGASTPLGEADVLPEEYALTMAVDALYRRRGKGGAPS